MVSVGQAFTIRLVDALMQLMGTLSDALNQFIVLPKGSLKIFSCHCLLYTRVQSYEIFWKDVRFSVGKVKERRNKLRQSKKIKRKASKYAKISYLCTS
jgi:hypothetical protein